MCRTLLVLGLRVADIGVREGEALTSPYVARALIALGVIVAWWAIRRRVLGDSRPERVRQMARVLREAAVGFRAIGAQRAQRGATTTIQGAVEWWGYYGRIMKFLDLGFTPHVRQDYNALESLRKQKLGSKFVLERECGRYLETLASRLTSESVDSRFVLPSTFEEFLHADWPENAPAAGSAGEEIQWRPVVEAPAKQSLPESRAPSGGEPAY
jgi:hypothetical protein